MIYIKVSPPKESVECTMHIGGVHWYASVYLSRKKLNGRSNLESLWSRTKGKVRHGHDITGRINHPSGRPVAFKQLLSAVLDALNRPVLFSPSILLLSQLLTDWRLTDRRLLKLVSLGFWVSRLVSVWGSSDHRRNFPNQHTHKI